MRSSDSDDIVSLKIELFRDRRLVVIKRAHYTIVSIVSIYHPHITPTNEKKRTVE